MKKNTSITFFTPKGIPSNELLRIVNDDSIINRYTSIKEYLLDQQITVDAKELLRLKSYVETNLEEQCRLHVFVMYRLFEVTGNWNDGSDFQVKLSFGKMLLGIPASEPFSYEHLLEFEKQVQANCESLGLIGRTEASLRSEFERWMPFLFGKRYPIRKNMMLNQLLAFVGSKYSIFLKKYNKGIAIILGNAQVKKIGIYTVVRFKNELLRSPSIPVSNAASVIENLIITRQESMRDVFHQKWAPLILSDDHDWRIKSDPYWNISYGIRRHALQLYDLKSKDDLSRIEEQLVSEMEEAIIYHEIGHTIIREVFLPIENIGIGLGAKGYNINFYDGLYELLADFAPKHKLGHGAMAQLIKISKTDKKRAERMFYTYLSDVWFFDTDDEFMFDYSSIVVLCMVRYINPDKSINFESMAKDITYKEDRTKQTQLTMIERVQEIFMWDTDEVGLIMKSAKFQMPSEELTFTQVVKDRLYEARKTYPEIDPEGYNFLQPLWTNMYMFIRHFTQEEDKITKLLTQSVKKNLMKFLVLSGGRSTAERYKFDHMQYIVDRFFELGLAQYPDQSRTIIS